MVEHIISIGLIMSLIYLVLIILIPVFLYSAQKWAHKSYLELREINKQLLNLPRITTHAQTVARYYAPKVPKREKED